MKHVTRHGKKMLLADESFNRMRIEAWIIGQLGNPPSLTEGDTTFKIRQLRIRDLILEREIFGHRVTAKSTQTWADVYERFYGEPLISKQTKGKRDVTPA